MSETDLPVGKAAAEQMAGIKPLPETAPEEPKTYSRGIGGLEEAARDVAAMRDAPADKPIERSYQWSDPENKAPRESVTLERAAHDYSEAHRQESEAQFAEGAQRLAQEVDRVRAAAAGIPDAIQEQPEVQQSSEIPHQPDELSQPPAGLSPKVAAALQDPEIRQAIEAPIQAAEQARQQYLQGLTQAAEFATAGVLSKLQNKYPNISQSEIPAAMSILQSQDPALFAEIRAEAGRAVELVRAAHQSQQMQQQMERQQFDAWAKQQDAALLSKAPELSDPEIQHKSAKSTLKALNNVGFTDDELARAWHGDAPVSMRDHRVQLIAWKAARYDEAMANATANPASRTNIPLVQKPGVAGAQADHARGSDVSAAMSRLKNSSGIGAARAAVDVLKAQRAARR